MEPENIKNCIISVSLPKSQKDFIEEHELSPSKIIQNAIDSMQENFKVGDKVIKEKNAKIERLMENLGKYRDFLEAKGLTNAFLGID